MTVYWEIVHYIPLPIFTLSFPWVASLWTTVNLLSFNHFRFGPFWIETRYRFGAFRLQKGFRFGPFTPFRPERAYRFGPFWSKIGHEFGPFWSQIGNRLGPLGSEVGSRFAPLRFEKPGDKQYYCTSVPQGFVKLNSKWTQILR